MAKFQKEYYFPQAISVMYFVGVCAVSQVPDCKPVPGLSEPAYQTGRVPFMPTTESGLKIQTTYVQTYARSFKT